MREAMTTSLKLCPDCERRLSERGDDYGDGSMCPGELHDLADRAPELSAALAGILELCLQPGEALTDRFERVAALYRAETGNWPPGKDAPPEMCVPPYEERRAAYDVWMDARIDAGRAALPKNEESTT